MEKLEKFIREAADGSHLVPLSHERIKPGSILDSRWASSIRNWFRVNILNRERIIHSLGRHKGYGWELLGIEDKNYKSTFEKGSILTGTIKDRFDFSGSGDLKPFGIDLDINFEENISSQLTVSEVRVKLFERGFAGHELRSKIRELKDKNDPNYANADECYLVVESFHLEGLEWQFDFAGLKKIKAILEQQGIDLAELGITWGGAASSILKVSGTSEAPIAVRGLKI